MTATTVNSMNFLVERCDARISAKVPQVMKDIIESEAMRLNVTESNYIKMAIQEKYERDNTAKTA